MEEIGTARALCQISVDQDLACLRVAMGTEPRPCSFFIEVGDSGEGRRAGRNGVQDHSSNPPGGITERPRTSLAVAREPVRMMLPSAGG